MLVITSDKVYENKGANAIFDETCLCTAQIHIARVKRSEMLVTGYRAVVEQRDLWIFPIATVRQEM